MNGRGLCFQMENNYIKKVLTNTFASDIINKHSKIKYRGVEQHGSSSGS